MMLKKRNLDVEARDHIMRVIQYQCRGLDSETVSALTKVVKNQVNHIHGSLRAQFDGAVKHFNQDPAAETWREWFQSLVTHLNGIDSLREPFITDAAVDKHFLRDDLELVSDIWAPILDVVQPGFLLNPAFSGYQAVFLQATRKIFADFLTLSIKSSHMAVNSNANLKVVETNAKTQALFDGDLNAGKWAPFGNQWPDEEVLNRPAPWRRTAGKAKMYGKLRFSAYSSQVKPQDVQSMIEDKRLEMPGLQPPAPGETLNIPGELVGKATMDHVDYLKDIAKADVNALEVILADIITRKRAILCAVDEAERWIAERKGLVDQILTEENMGVLAWGDLIEQGKAKIRACYEAERDARVCRRELPSNHVPLKDMMSTFIGLVRAMKEIKDIPVESPVQKSKEATEKPSTDTGKSNDVVTGMDGNISLATGFEITATGFEITEKASLGDRSLTNAGPSPSFATRNTGFGTTEKASLGDSCFTNAGSSPGFANTGFGINEKASLGDSCFTNAGSSSNFATRNTGFGTTEKASLGDRSLTNAGPSPSFATRNTGFGTTEKASLGDSCFTNAGSSPSMVNTGFGITEKASVVTNAGFGDMGFGGATDGYRDEGEETE
jgi:hypothetical protein